jgi:hypothetical protein
MRTYPNVKKAEIRHKIKLNTKTSLSSSKSTTPQIKSKCGTDRIYYEQKKYQEVSPLNI